MKENERKRREKDEEWRRAKARDKRKRMEEEDKNSKAAPVDPPGESLSEMENLIEVSPKRGNSQKRQIKRQGRVALVLVTVNCQGAAIAMMSIDKTCNQTVRTIITYSHM